MACEWVLVLQLSAQSTAPKYVLQGEARRCVDDVGWLNWRPQDNIAESPLLVVPAYDHDDARCSGRQHCTLGPSPHRWEDITLYRLHNLDLLEYNNLSARQAGAPDLVLQQVIAGSVTFLEATKIGSSAPPSLLLCF